MADVIFVAVLVAFFSLSVVFVKLCERIVGGAEVTAIDTPESPEPIEVAA